MSQEKVMNRWLVVVGAVLIQLCLGALYAWSLFNAPLVAKFGWSQASVVLTFSYTLMTICVFVIIAGKLQDKIGPRWVATTGGIILGLGCFLTSQATTLNQLYLYYGFIAGAGVGTAYVCPLAACLKWFPDKRGLISGIAVAGMGAGALLFKPIILSFIASYGVSQTFLYLGIIYATVVVIGAQLLLSPPPGYVPAGWTPPAVTANSKGNNFTTSQMLGTMQFYVIFVMYLFGCTAGLMIIGLAKDIGTKLVLLNAATAANAVVAVSVFNAAGRITWGMISDKIGRTPALTMMYILAALAMFGMSSITMTYGSFLALCSLIGFCFGGFLSIYPSITADFYGTKNIGINYGLVFLAYGAAALLGPKIATAVPFQQAFLISAVLCAIGAGMTFLIRKAPQL